MAVDSRAPSRLRQSEARNDKRDTSECYRPSTAVPSIHRYPAAFRGGCAGTSMSPREVQRTSSNYSIYVTQDAICSNWIPNRRTGTAAYCASSEAVVSCPWRAITVSPTYRSQKPPLSQNVPSTIYATSSALVAVPRALPLRLWYVPGLRNPAADACFRLMSRQLMDIQNATHT